MFCTACFQSKRYLGLPKDIWKFHRAGQGPNDHPLALTNLFHKYFQIYSSIFLGKNENNIVNNVYSFNM